MSHQDAQECIERLQADGFWVIGPDLADDGDTIELLDNADYRVVRKRPKAPRPHPFQTRLTDYDPATGQLVETRFATARDEDGRPF